MDIDTENSQEEKQLTEDLCPVHNIPLQEGKCYECGICYSCEDH